MKYYKQDDKTVAIINPNIKCLCKCTDNTYHTFSTKQDADIAIEILKNLK